MKHSNSLIVTDWGRNEIMDFLKKAYELVDDPSTDSIISWSPNGSSFLVLKPLECSRDLLTQRLQITNFARFQAYGFRKIDIPSGQELEFACDDFVRGQPELLEKIAERYVAKLKDDDFWVLNERVKNATSKEESDLARKEAKELLARKIKECKARVAARMVVTSSPAQGLEDQV